MKLLEPLDLGARTAATRVMFGPHETNLGEGRAISERHVAYYARRAAGGAGIIVTEEASVHDSDWPYERCPLAALSSRGWADVAAACHPHGALVFAALGHAGGQGSSAYSQAPMWAPSRVPEVNTREVPKSMEPHEVDSLIVSFASAATAAVTAGCDGVEINIGQFSLLRQFLSGLTNQRSDEWADRSRLPRAVLEAVRSAIGPNAVLGVRLSCDELAPWAGIVPAAGGELAAELAEHADYLVVVRGSIFSASATRPDGHTEPGFNLELAASVRQAVRTAHGERVAVFAQGSIIDVSMAEAALAANQADGVEMTRAQIADADLVSKVRSGAVDRIRPCVLCNQVCQVRDARNPVVTCVVDPRSGHELTDTDVERSGAGSIPGSQSVTVVGGGPAGLEAARVAATRGHRVRLVERNSTLGGSLSVAAQGGGRSALATFVVWQRSECERLDVEFETGTTLTAADLASVDGPVIMATGSVGAPINANVTRAAVVLGATDVLASLGAGESAPSLPDGPVVIWDPIGGPIAVSVAEALAWSGRDITFVTPDNIVGNELSRSGDLAPCNARLQQAGVTLVRRSLLRSVKKGSVVLEDRFAGTSRTVKAAFVIDCGHRLPDESLYRAAESVGLDVVRAGDCVAPRTLLEAVREGRGAVLAIEGHQRRSDGVPMGSGVH